MCYFLKATSRLFGKAYLIQIDNHRWYFVLDIQLHFSYFQLTQRRVLITLFLNQLGTELLKPISWQQRIEEIE